MTDLVACVSDEKGAFNHLKKVVEAEEWEDIFLIATKKFPINISKKFRLIVIDEKKTISELVHEIKDKLKGKIKGIEVGVNIVCGKGKEHIAVMSAILKLGLGVRFIVLTKDGVREV